jgi:pimeloyl-ACP methyl ester carboxylesterase
MVYDMNRKQGLNEQGLLMLKNYNNGGPQAALAKITAPTMILWGMQNPTVMHLEADVFSYWMTNAPTLVKKYPKVGHYLYLEIPDEVHRDVAAFLSGELDGELRQTQRVAVSSAPAAAPQRAAE